jgi:uncharacterized membrane protein
MSNKRDTIIQWVSLLAGGLIALQIAFILSMGDAFCFNEGCRVVEKLTTLSPLYINLAGLLYFAALFIASRWLKVGFGVNLGPLLLLLLIGLAVEGVLVSYQYFVIRTYCSYCLVIFAIIAVLNILCGWKQIVLGAPLFAAMVAAFAVLNFSPAALLALRSENLDVGTYAVRKCDVAAKKLYFFFSADCPHCKNVLTVLENCNSCEFHFNPIEQIQGLAIPELEYTTSYSPSLNRVVLSMLNITTIPVLLVANPDGLTFIKGEENIIRFVSQACSPPQQEISIDATLYEGQGGMERYEEPVEECEIEVECLDPTAQGQSSYAPKW